MSTPVSSTAILIPCPVYPRLHACGASILNIPQLSTSCPGLTVWSTWVSSMCTLKFSITFTTSPSSANSLKAPSLARTINTLSIQNLFSTTPPRSLILGSIFSCVILAHSFNALTARSWCPLTFIAISLGSGCRRTASVSTSSSGAFQTLASSDGWNLYFHCVYCTGWFLACVVGGIIDITRDKTRIKSSILYRLWDISYHRFAMLSRSCCKI